MANETRIRANFVAGALDAALASGATSMSSPALADLPAIGATEHAAISLFAANSDGRITAKEIVYVTAHTASATTATIARGKEGTTGVAWSSGDKWEHASTTLDFIGRLDAKVYRSAVYGIPSDGGFIPWDAEEWDYGGFHDTATNNSRLTVPAGHGGLYQVGYSITSTDAIGDTKRVIGAVYKNGVTVRGSVSEVDGSGASSFPGVTAVSLVELVAGDYVEASLYQDSGSAKGLARDSSAFWIKKADF